MKSSDKPVSAADRMQNIFEREIRTWEAKGLNANRTRQMRLDSLYDDVGRLFDIFDSVYIDNHAYDHRPTQYVTIACSFPAFEKLKPEHIHTCAMNNFVNPNPQFMYVVRNIDVDSFISCCKKTSWGSYTDKMMYESHLFPTRVWICMSVMLGIYDSKHIGNTVHASRMRPSIEKRCEMVCMRFVAYCYPEMSDDKCKHRMESVLKTVSTFHEQDNFTEAEYLSFALDTATRTIEESEKLVLYTKFSRGMHKCAGCGCHEYITGKCGNCKIARYCNETCQKIHWKDGGHRQFCKLNKSI